MGALIWFALAGYSATSTPLEIIVSPSIQSKNQRDALSRLLNSENIVNFRSEIADTDQPLTVIYEGREQALKLISVNEVPINFFERPQKPPKQSAARTPDLAFKRIENGSFQLQAENLKLDKAIEKLFGNSLQLIPSMPNSVVLVEHELVTSGSWPLNWKLSSEDNRPMTLREIRLVLGKHYGWWDYEPVRAERDMSPICKCGDEMVWPGGVENATARDLVAKMLQHCLACDGDGKQSARKYQNFHILPMGTSGGKRLWRMVVF